MTKHWINASEIEPRARPELVFVDDFTRTFDLIGGFHTREDPYFIEFDRCRTFGQLHEWVAHLAAKTWCTTEHLSQLTAAVATVNKRDPRDRVYYVRGGSRVKIGFSRDPEVRLRSLQTGNPTPLKLLGTEPGGVERERAVHEHFSALRLKGEWFAFSRELRDFIENACRETRRV